MLSCCLQSAAHYYVVLRESIILFGKGEKCKQRKNSIPFDNLQESGKSEQLSFDNLRDDCVARVFVHRSCLLAPLPSVSRAGGGWNHHLVTYRGRGN